MKTILFSAGDLSGERAAADLARAIRGRWPDARLVGMGGAAMAEAGVELAVDQRALAVGGLLEVAGSLGSITRAWRAMGRCVLSTRPDLIVLVDSGGFNLPFARRARRLCDAPILYYVAPQVWAWRAGRAARLASRADRIAVILPFERDFYAERGIPVDFVGHPLLDRMPRETAEAAEDAATEARRALGVEAGAPLLGIFPGSRRNEVERNLPVQLAAYRALRARIGGDPGVSGLVGLAPSIEPDLARRVAGAALADASAPVRIVSMDEAPLLDALDVALAKPGTITTELMLRRKPMVVVGRGNPLSAWVARRRVQVEWLAMPNLLLGRPVVPELLQGDATPDRIAAALAPLFRGEARKRQQDALGLASERLGSPGAAERVADIVGEMLGTAGA